MLTDFVKIATAGPTIDGREIAAEWLQSAAKTYDRDLFIAALNVEHFSDFGLGDVFDVKFEKDDQGRPSLFARLDARAQLLQWGQDGYKPFFSAEILPDFPRKGEWYLSGLAVTGFPASLGLKPVKFSAEKVQTFSQGIQWAAPNNGGGLINNHPPENELNKPADDGQDAGLIARFVAAIVDAVKPSQTNQTESDPMTREEIEKFNGLQTQVEKLAAQVEKLSAAAPAPAPAPAPAADAPAAPEPEATPQLFAVLEKLASGLTAVTEKLAAMDAKFSAPVNGVPNVGVSGANNAAQERVC